MKAFDDCFAEFGAGTTSEEFVEFNEKTCVWVGSLDDFGGRFVAGTASSCNKINSHVEF